MKIYKDHFVVLDLALNLSAGRLVVINRKKDVPLQRPYK